jgi:hypothetical protein
MYVCDACEQEHTKAMLLSKIKAVRQNGRFFKNRNRRRVNGQAEYYNKLLHQNHS